MLNSYRYYSLMQLEKYVEYMKKIGDRPSLFNLIHHHFSIETATYPGSYIDITPSLFFPITNYIDTDKKAKKFFAHQTEISTYIQKHKTYEQESILTYYPEDYRTPFTKLQNSSELLISLYAGFISKYCKSFLKKHGILLANDSHGDASMAYLNTDYSLYGVINYSDNHYIFTKDELEKFFIPKKKIAVTKELLKQTNRGIKYTHSADFYVFKRK